MTGQKLTKKVGVTDLKRGRLNFTKNLRCGNCPVGNVIESMGKLKFFARFRELGKCLFPSVIWRKNRRR